MAWPSTEDPDLGTAGITTWPLRLVGGDFSAEQPGKVGGEKMGASLASQVYPRCGEMLGPGTVPNRSCCGGLRIRTDSNERAKRSHAKTAMRASPHIPPELTL